MQRNDLSIPTLRLALLLAIFAISIDKTAHALLVGTTSGVVPATNVNPADYVGWTQGDPGWANVTTGGNNYIYLGDGWVLSARHVGTGPVVLPTGTYERINNSYYNNYGFQNSVANPQNLTNPANGSPLTLSDYSDLQLFRIKGDPGLPSLKIATDHFNLNPFPPNANNSPELVMIGQGFTRGEFEGNWGIHDADPDPNKDNWVWYSPNPTFNKLGYFSNNHYDPNATKVKTWGTNRLANTSSNSNVYETILSSTTGVVKLNKMTASETDLIVLATSYDKFTQNGTNGATEFETQAVAGDSGSAVFYKRNGQWELAGIVNAVSAFSNQPPWTAIYDQLTLISDLSYYNQDYAGSIYDIMDKHKDYSWRGDVNLDGIVSGDGSGPVSSDDVSAFVAGWGNINYVDINGTSTVKGTVNSWQKGDLNRDGITDVSDFLLLRRELNGAVSGSVIESLFGSTTIPGNGGVPEPTSACLAMLAAAVFSLMARRGRRVAS